MKMGAGMTTSFECLFRPAIARSLAAANLDPSAGSQFIPFIKIP